MPPADNGKHAEPFPWRSAVSLGPSGVSVEAIVVIIRLTAAVVLTRRRIAIRIAILRTETEILDPRDGATGSRFQSWLSRLGLCGRRLRGKVTVI